MLNEGPVAAPFQNGWCKYRRRVVYVSEILSKNIPTSYCACSKVLELLGAVTIASGWRRRIWQFPIMELSCNNEGSPTIVTYNPQQQNANARNFAVPADRTILSDAFGVSSQRSVGRVVDSTGDTLRTTSWHPLHCRSRTIRNNLCLKTTNIRTVQPVQNRFFTIVVLDISIHIVVIGCQLVSSYAAVAHQMRRAIWFYRQAVNCCISIAC